VIGFILGFLSGNGCLLAVAIWMAARSKPKQQAQPQHGVSATSVSTGGNRQNVPAPTVAQQTWNDRLLQEALKHYQGEA
jgi:hypothetical protein